MQFYIQRLDNSAYIQIQLNAYICTQSLSSRKTLECSISQPSTHLSQKITNIQGGKIVQLKPCVMIKPHLEALNVQPVQPQPCLTICESEQHRAVVQK